MKLASAVCLLSCLVLAAAENGNRYALLVGVSEYGSNSGLKSLQYPESDMLALRDTLKDIGFEDTNIWLMVAGARDPRFRPERKKILNELKLLLANKHEQDTLLVVLSGHGLQPREKDNSYYCPIDASLKDQSSWLDLNSVFAELKECNAGGKLLICDCCRQEPELANIRGLPEDAGPLKLINKIKPPATVAALFSCGNGEAAFEETELKSGVFTHFLIKGLRGGAALGGVVEAKALASYLQINVYDYVSKKRGASQVPSFQMESGKPLVLCRGVAPIPPPPPRKEDNATAEKRKRIAPKVEPVRSAKSGKYTASVASLRLVGEELVLNVVLNNEMYPAAVSFAVDSDDTAKAQELGYLKGNVSTGPAPKYTFDAGGRAPKKSSGYFKSLTDGLDSLSGELKCVSVSGIPIDTQGHIANSLDMASASKASFTVRFKPAKGAVQDAEGPFQFQIKLTTTGFYNVIETSTFLFQGIEIDK